MIKARLKKCKVACASGLFVVLSNIVRNARFIVIYINST